jgi:hypothetical protein
MVCSHYKDLRGKLRSMRGAQHVAGMGGNRNAYKILVGEPEEERIRIREG